MILQFAKEIDGKPTFFIEKIWESILRNGVECNLNDLIKYLEEFTEVANYIIGTHKAKIHTIRKDSTNRWNKETAIHAYTSLNIASKLLGEQFAPKFKCTGTQEIEIKFYRSSRQILRVIVDGRDLTLKEIVELSVNDGFDSVEEFAAYFKTNYKGKIIHWTDYKY